MSFSENRGEKLNDHTSVPPPDTDPLLDVDVGEVVNWADKSLWIVVGLILLGHLARNLVSDEPFKLKKFVGEMVLAGIGAIVIYLLGILQGLPEIQIVLIGSLTSLGGIRALEWAAKIYRITKSIN